MALPIWTSELQGTKHTGLQGLEYPQKTCLTCLIGKQSKRTFPSKSSRRPSIQHQLVH